MMCKLLLLFLIIGLDSYLCKADNDYIYYPEVNISYKFHKTPLKWGEARLKCIDEKAVLAMPKNPAEVQLLKRIFEGHPKSSLTGVTHPDYILLRFHDLFAENEYLTDEGHPLQYFYHVWNTGQPDNAGNNEDCGSMHRTGYINDYPCGVAAVFVCQKENQPYLAEIDSLHINLDPAYMFESHSKKRFKLHTNPRTWDQARAMCQSEGGQLANVESKQEEDFLVNMINKPENKVHYVVHKDYALLGFHDYFVEGKFVTTKGKPLNSLGYIRWNPGQPDNAGGAENCGSIHSTGGINDFPCSVAARFICEMKTIDMIDVRSDFNNPHSV